MNQLGDPLLIPQAKQAMELTNKTIVNMPQAAIQMSVFF